MRSSYSSGDFARAFVFQIRVLGDDSVLAQAVMTGIVDGAVLGYAFSRLIPRSGGSILADLPTLIAKFYSANSVSLW